MNVPTFALALPRVRARAARQVSLDMLQSADQTIGRHNGARMWPVYYAVDLLVSILAITSPHRALPYLSGWLVLNLVFSLIPAVVRGLWRLVRSKNDRSPDLVADLRTATEQAVVWFLGAVALTVAVPYVPQAMIVIGGVIAALAVLIRGALRVRDMVRAERILRSAENNPPVGYTVYDGDEVRAQVALSILHSRQ